MDKSHDLANITFGQRVAEEEVNELATYFVETDQWRKIWAGDVDIVYGPKGSGKSAIYFLLSSRADNLFDREIILIPAENPRGTPAFSDLVEDPPTTEAEFRALWKLYLLALIGEQFQDYDLTSTEATQVSAALEEAGLLEPKSTLQRKLSSALHYIRSWLNPESIEGGIQLDPTTGMPIGVTGKISPREPSPEQASKGIVSLDALYQVADIALREAGLTAWIVLDRLDVAFAERRDLEENALRALFRVYVDLLSLENIKLKVFLRDDIWKRITSSGGFREASHITRTETISWDEDSLMHLIIRRTIQNSAIQERYGVTPDDVMASTESQKALFFRIFPQQIDQGLRRPDSFKWILGRTRDGTGKNAPRELIHLLEAARSEQLHSLEVGHEEPTGETLIGAASIRAALAEVSKARLELTLYAEYPEYRDSIQALEGGKAEHSVPSLMKVWGSSEEDARATAQALVDIGFFELRGDQSHPSYWVPFLYRDALNLIMGTAES